jgi:hypothetical protein
VDYLNSLWSSALSELPKEIKSFVYIEAIYHICNSIIGILNSSKKISPYFVSSCLEVDVKFLKSFVSSLGDPNLDEIMLEIHQVMNLLQVDNPVEEYLVPAIKSKKYSRISKQLCLSLLEKVRESGVYADQGSMFMSLSLSPTRENAKEKDMKAEKKKNVDMVIKALKDDIGRR